MAKLIDKEVVKIVRKAQVTAERILKKNISKLHGIADALLEKETINGDDVLALVNGQKLAPSKNGTTKRNKSPRAKKKS